MKEDRKHENKSKGGKHEIDKRESGGRVMKDQKDKMMHPPPQKKSRRKKKKERKREMQNRK